MLLTWGLSHFRGKEADKPVKQISPGNFIGDQTTFHAKDLFATWAHDHLLPHPERAGWREGGTPSLRLYSAHNKFISCWALQLSLLPTCFFYWLKCCLLGGPHKQKARSASTSTLPLESSSTHETLMCEVKSSQLPKHYFNHFLYTWQSWPFF